MVPRSQIDSFKVNLNINLNVKNVHQIKELLDMFTGQLKESSEAYQCVEFMLTKLNMNYLLIFYLKLLTSEFCKGCISFTKYLEVLDIMYSFILEIRQHGSLDNISLNINHMFYAITKRYFMEAIIGNSIEMSNDRLYKMVLRKINKFQKEPAFENY